MKPLDIEIRRPIAPSVAMFVCAEVALRISAHRDRLFR